METKHFTDKQQQVIDTLNGPVMVVACPGSGKTTVIVNRANNLVKHNIPEERILVITFTKDSATEMKNRYEKNFGKTNISFGTIHSTCLNMIQAAYPTMNIRDSILQSSEQIQFMVNEIEDYDIGSNLELTELAKALITDISRVKNSCLDYKKYKSGQVETEEFIKVYEDYDKYKKNRNLIDFDDMLIICKNLLKDYPQILEYWQQYYQYIMIDEYQDTNSIQADIFYMIARKHRNICIVGDDDQAIYGFRAADSSIMMNFEKEFTDCKRIDLDTNFRSYKEIIDVASVLIKNNKARFEKDFKVGKKDTKAHGSVVVSKTAAQDFARDIAEKMKKRLKKGEKLSDTAILYRTNDEAQWISSYFIKEKIPFYLTDHFKDMHDSFIFLDMLTYWNLANENGKYGDFAKIMNRPTKYLKQAPFNNIKNIYTERSEVMKIIDNMHLERWKEAKAKQSIFEMIESIKGMKDAAPDMFFKKIKALGYRNWLHEYEEYRKVTKDDFIKIFDFLKDEAKSFNSMNEWFSFAEEQRMRMSRKNKQEQATDKESGVRLATFHSSKGLEWETVYIINANEGVCPYKKSLDDNALIEEERRLFYVAMTRAKKQLTIALDPSGKISRFVNEISNAPGIVMDPEIANAPAKQSSKKTPMSSDLDTKVLKKTTPKVEKKSIYDALPDLSSLMTNVDTPPKIKDETGEVSKPKPKATVKRKYRKTASGE